MIFNWKRELISQISKLKQENYLEVHIFIKENMILLKISSIR